MTTLNQPRKIGGLGLLDPLQQQQALQWRWICPLLLDYLKSPLLPICSVPSLSFINSTLVWFFLLYYITFFHYFYYLLFPGARHEHWFFFRPNQQKLYRNPFQNIQACFDTFTTSAYSMINILLVPSHVSPYLFMISLYNNFLLAQLLLLTLDLQIRCCRINLQLRSFSSAMYFCSILRLRLFVFVLHPTFLVILLFANVLPD